MFERMFARAATTPGPWRRWWRRTSGPPPSDLHLCGERRDPRSAGRRVRFHGMSLFEKRAGGSRPTAIPSTWARLAPAVFSPEATAKTIRRHRLEKCRNVRPDPGVDLHSAPAPAVRPHAVRRLGLIFVLMRLVPGTSRRSSSTRRLRVERGAAAADPADPPRAGLDARRHPVPRRDRGAVRGDFGQSYVQRRPVMDILKERFPRSMELAALTLLIAVVWAVPLGVVSAVRQTSSRLPARRVSLSGSACPCSSPGRSSCTGSCASSGGCRRSIRVVHETR